MDNTTYPNCPNNFIACWDRVEGSSSRTKTWSCVKFVQWACDLPKNCDPPPLKANPDVAGPGVIWSFVVSALLAWLFLVLFFLVCPTGKEKRQNKINHYWTKWACKPVQEKIIKEYFRSDPALYAECCFRIVLALSDQQLATGIAILLAGLILRGQHQISVYHLSIVADLAWLASAIHLATLAILTTYFTESNRIHGLGRRKYKGVPFVTLLRVFLMLGTCGMLIYVTWIQGYGAWYDVYTRPAHCISTDPKYWYGEQKAWAISSIVILIYNYSLTIAILVMKATGARSPLRDKIKARNDKVEQSLRGSPVLSKVYVLVKTCVVWVWYIALSDIFSIVVTGIWIGLGISWTFEDRDYGLNGMTREERSVEAAFGFGQLVPLILLILPLMALLETYHENTVQEGLQRTDTEQIMAMEEVSTDEADTGSRASVATSLRPLRSPVEASSTSLAPRANTWWSGFSAGVRLRGRATRTASQDTTDENASNGGQ